jgi:hypothetical protein
MRMQQAPGGVNIFGMSSTLGSDPAAIGKTFRRLDTIFTIIGSDSAGILWNAGGQDPDITISLTMDAEVRGGRHACMNLGAGGSR